jgi:hypothetical protein
VPIRGVAFLAGKILPSHVDIKGGGWIQQGAAKVAMLDVVTATSIPVASAAIGSSGSSYIFSNFRQVNPFIGVSAFIVLFGIFSCGIMAYEAIDIGHIRKIKRFVLPSITGMTFGAPAPIGFNAHSVVVH